MESVKGWWQYQPPKIRTRKEAREFASNGEPWGFNKANDEFHTDSGHDVGTNYYGPRIVECVNACAGIPNPAGLKAVVDALLWIRGGLSAGTINNPKGRAWHDAILKADAALNGLSADALIERGAKGGAA